MTITEAREHIGDSVTYQPGHGPLEVGWITDVRGDYVFVMYAGDRAPKATRAADLTLLVMPRSETDDE